MTWAAASVPPHDWRSVAASADGNKLVAVAAASFEQLPVVLLSTNAGATWTPTDTPPGEWSAATISGDGNSVLLLGSGLCILSSPAPGPPAQPSPRLHIGLSRASLDLSWLVLSSRLVLQQSSDLTSPDWADVTNQPTLNFTNLQNELTLPQRSGSAFYRLKQK